MFAALPDTDECIDWPFATASGYGVVVVDRRKRQATHVALEQAGQPRPPAPGNHALHSCDRPICVNPRHLRWGTDKENKRDMVERGRDNHRGALGERNSHAVLTEDKVRAIRAERADGAKETEVAARYGISPQAVGHITRRETWKHVR